MHLIMHCTILWLIVTTVNTLSIQCVLNLVIINYKKIWFITTYIINNYNALYPLITLYNALYINGYPILETLYFSGLFGEYKVNIKILPCWIRIWICCKAKILYYCCCFIPALILSSHFCLDEGQTVCQGPPDMLGQRLAEVGMQLRLECHQGLGYWDYLFFIAIGFIIFSAGTVSAWVMGVLMVLYERYSKRKSEEFDSEDEEETVTRGAGSGGGGGGGGGGNHGNGDLSKPGMQVWPEDRGKLGNLWWTDSELRTEQRSFLFYKEV